MLVEMGAEEGQRFARRALVKFASQALSGAPRVGGMNISTFTDGERHALAQAFAMVLVRWLGLVEQRFRLAKWSVCRG